VILTIIAIHLTFNIRAMMAMGLLILTGLIALVTYFIGVAGRGIAVMTDIQRQIVD